MNNTANNRNYLLNGDRSIKMAWVFSLGHSLNPIDEPPANPRCPPISPAEVYFHRIG